MSNPTDSKADEYLSSDELDEAWDISRDLLLEWTDDIDEIEGTREQAIQAWAYIMAAESVVKNVIRAGLMVLEREEMKRRKEELN